MFSAIQHVWGMSPDFDDFPTITILSWKSLEMSCKSPESIKTRRFSLLSTLYLAGDSNDSIHPFFIIIDYLPFQVSSFSGPTNVSSRTLNI
jgi:hypothetical protein